MVAATSNHRVTATNQHGACPTMRYEVSAKPNRKTDGARITVAQLAEYGRGPAKLA
jgi:hypothetical protein